MKKMFLIMMLSLSAIFTTGCAQVKSGYVGVEVNMYGDEKGVSSQDLPVGRYWYNPFTSDIYVFPTFTQTYTWAADNTESISFQTVEGLSVNADVGITYHVDHTKASILFQKYRRGIDEITNVYLHNMVRDSFVSIASKQPIESVYGAGKAALVQAVQDQVAAEVGPIGLIIERIYLVGNLRLPETITDSINAKIKATQDSQQRENQVATAQAQARIEIAKAEGEGQAMLAVAEAKAKSIQIEGDALSRNPNVVQLRTVEKWDGVLPQVSGSATPFINLQLK